MFRWVGDRPRAWLLLLGLQLPALRTAYKYVPADFREVAIVFYGVGAYFLYTLLLGPRLRPLLSRVLNRRGVLVYLFLILSAVNFVAYPFADSLKQQGRGSDQDDALIEAVHGLFRGENPFETVSYRNQYPSAGPGWILMNAPPVAANGYFLLTPLYVLLAAYAIQKLTRRREQAALFILLLCSSPAFWELMIVGSDFLAIGALFLILAILLLRAETTKSRVWSSVLLGFAATARVLFAYLVPLFAIFEWKHDRRAGLLIFAIGLAVAGVLHLSFYLWNPQGYSPLTALGKGVGLQGKWPVLIALAACAAAGLWSIFTAQADPENRFFRLWLCIFLPMLFVAIGDLRTEYWDFARWEGANYFAVAMPMFAAWAAFRYHTANLNRTT